MSFVSEEVTPSESPYVLQQGQLVVGNVRRGAVGAAKDTARVAKPGDSQFFSNKAEGIDISSSSESDPSNSFF